MTDTQQLLTRAVHHFESLFTGSPYELRHELSEDYNAQVTYDANMDIEALPTAAEVLESIKSLSPDSAPSSDGFTG